MHDHHGGGGWTGRRRPGDDGSGTIRSMALVPPDAEAAAALFRVSCDGDGRLLATVRYVAPLEAPGPQRELHIAGRDAILAVLADLLDAVAGLHRPPSGGMSDGAAV